MKITEDVIIDLLPVYQSGEASDDTRQLVEAYLAQHPEFKQLLSKFDHQLDVLDSSHPQPQNEKEALMRVKKILKYRSTLLAFAGLFSLLPLSMKGSSDEGLTWFLLRDQPAIAVALWVIALVAWGAYAWTFYMLSDS